MRRSGRGNFIHWEQRVERVPLTSLTTPATIGKMILWIELWLDTTSFSVVGPSSPSAKEPVERS